MPIVPHDGARTTHRQRDRVRDAPSLERPRGEIARCGLVQRPPREHRPRVVLVCLERDGDATAGRDADTAGGHVVHQSWTQ